MWPALVMPTPGMPCRRNGRFCDGRPCPAINRPAGVQNPCPQSTSHNQRCHKVLQRQRHGNARPAMLASAPPTSSRVCRSMPSPRRHRLVTAVGVPSSHTRLMPRLSGGRATQAPCPYGFSAGRLDWSTCCPLPLPPAAGRSDRLRQRGPRPARLLARRRVWVLGLHHAASHVLTSACLANRHVMVAVTHCGTDVDVDTDLGGQDRVRLTVRQTLEWRRPWQTLSRPDDLACCGGIDGITPQR
jgi:hypothetical protein